MDIACIGLQNAGKVRLVLVSPPDTSFASSGTSGYVIEQGV